jgi:hypothetical protein
VTAVVALVAVVITLSTGGHSHKPVVTTESGGGGGGKTTHTSGGPPATGIPTPGGAQTSPASSPGGESSTSASHGGKHGQRKKRAEATLRRFWRDVGHGRYQAADKLATSRGRADSGLLHELRAAGAAVSVTKLGHPHVSGKRGTAVIVLYAATRHHLGRVAPGCHRFSGTVALARSGEAWRYDGFLHRPSVTSVRSSGSRCH